MTDTQRQTDRSRNEGTDRQRQTGRNIHAELGEQDRKEEADMRRQRHAEIDKSIKIHTRTEKQANVQLHTPRNREPDTDIQGRKGGEKQVRDRQAPIGSLSLSVYPRLYVPP